MAYFGRTPKKPGSVPGSQSGNQELRGVNRRARLVRQLLQGRQERSGRINRSVRNVRANRSGRTGR